MSRNTMHSFTAQFSIITGTMLISKQIVNHVFTKIDQFMIPVNYKEIKSRPL